MNEKHQTPAETLAKALGVKEQTLADWRNAPTVPPRLWTTQDLADFTQRSVSSIEGDTNGTRPVLPRIQRRLLIHQRCRSYRLRILLLQYAQRFLGREKGRKGKGT